MAAAGLIDYAALLGGFTTEATAGIQASLPIAVPIAAGLLGIGLAVKLIRKFAKG